MVILIIFLILALLYVLSLMGRHGKPEMEALKKWRYAHRGLHSPGIPENSMAAFRAALENGYGIELDVHLLKDGSLAVIHDSDLKRVTGQDGFVEDLTAEELTNYHLLGTEQTIPQFRDVLALFSGKAPMIIELKSFRGNHDALSERVCQEMEGYSGLYCMESFDPYCVRWLYRHRPEIVRGQLSENSLKSKPPFSLPVRFLTSFYLENFLTRPDFIAYHFPDRKTLSNTLCRKLWGITGVSWTLKNRQDYDTALAEGWIPIFEGFRPEPKE